MRIVAEVGQKQRALLLKMYRQIAVDRKNYISKKEIISFKKKMKSSYPQYKYVNIIANLFQFLLEQYQITHDDLHNIQKEDLISDNSNIYDIDSQSAQIYAHGLPKQIKTKQTENDQHIQYITQEQIPPILYKQWNNYHPQSSPYFDQVLIDKEQQHTLRSKEKRLMVDSFINHGYAYCYLQPYLKNKSKQIRIRYKTVLYSVAVATMRSIEAFLLRANRKDILSLRQMDFKMPSYLLNCRKYFPKQHIQTFFKCLKTNYLLFTEPAHENDVCNFYNYFQAIYNKQIRDKEKLYKVNQKNQGRNHSEQSEDQDDEDGDEEDEEEDTDMTEQHKMFQKAVNQYKQTLTKKRNSSKKYTLDENRMAVEGDEDIDLDFLDHLEDYSASQKQNKNGCHDQWSEVESYEEPFQNEINEAAFNDFNFSLDEPETINEDDPAFNNILKNVVEIIAKKELKPK